MDNSVEEESSGKFWDFQENCRLRNIVPEEIWIIIANMLDGHSTDLENFCNTSPYFRDLFLQKRVYFLFPEVLRILAKWEQKRKQANSKTSHVTQNPSDQQSSLVRCRSVCQSWRNEVDKYYQSQPSHFQADPRDLNRQLCEKGHGTHTVFTHPAPSVSQQRLELFVDHFEETHNLLNSPAVSINPFVSRSVTFEGIDNWNYTSKEEEHENAARYWYGIDQLLSRYGHHLWYCDIFLENKLEFLYQRYLSGWLKHMPNLRVLKIYYGQREKVLNTPEEIQSWEEEIAEYPLPKLEHLQFLQVVGLPAPVFNELIRKNSHVTRLDVTPKVWKRKWICEGYDMHSLPLTRLRNLTMKISSLDDLEKLSASQTKWPLNKLDIGFVESRSKDFADWSRIFQLLTNNWANTLTDLSLQMSSEVKEFKNLTLNLPQLRDLKLVLPSWMPMDFIGPLQNSLQNLHVVVEGKQVISFLNSEKKMKLSEEIQFMDCHNGKRLASYFWTRFQKLQELHVERASCSCESGLHNDGCSFDQYLYKRQQWTRKRKTRS